MSFSVVTAPEDRVETSSEIIYKVAGNRREREGAFRLIHDAYVRAGLMEPRSHGMRITPYHLLPTTDMFVAVLRDEVICTLSLVRDGELGLPMECIYSAEVNRLRTLGVSVAEVSSLADRRGDIRRIIPVLVNLLKVVGQSAQHNGIGQTLIATHPRHARFYERYLYFERIGEEKVYPSVQNHPAVACRLDLEGLQESHPNAHELYFGTPLDMEQIRSRCMSLADLSYFTQRTDLDEHAVALASDAGQQRQGRTGSSRQGPLGHENVC